MSLTKEFKNYALYKLKAHLGKVVKVHGIYSTWEEAYKGSGGYDDSSIASKSFTSARAVQQGEYAFERDSVLFNEHTYSLPVVLGISLVLSKNNAQLRVLDFGGGYGSTFYQHSQLLNSIERVQWTILEQQHVVQLAHSVTWDDRLRFFQSVEDAVKEPTPDIILFSSVLQYLAQPYYKIEELISSVGKRAIIIIDRTPVTQFEQDVITVQRVPSKIYRGSYPLRFLSEEKLLRVIHQNHNVFTQGENPEGRVFINTHVSASFKYLVCTPK